MAGELTVLHEHDVVTEALRGAYVAIGNFDGVHKGHQYLIHCMMQRAKQAQKPAAVLTFEPHPRQFFNPTKPFFRLTHCAAKEQILGKIGLAGLFIRPFNQELAGLTAADFIDLLQHNLHISGIVIGHDFHFGRNREGTPDKLKALCAERGLSYDIVAPFSNGSEVVSSSLIRSALTEGDVETANHLLGYYWFVRSVVVHGAKRGRELGYPTANLELDPGCGLRHGVYGVRVRLPNGSVYGGVASFGRRPMFDNGAPLLEVHLFDFSGDLYDQEIDVEILGWIRPEMRFSGLQDLIEAMARDSATARQQVGGAAGLSMII